MITAVEQPPLVLWEVSTNLSLDDLVHESVDVLGSEGMLEGGHLIHTAAQGPDVRLVVVRFVSKQLRAHIVRSANHGTGEVT